ncbi:hypothetical protein ElyMa_006757200 [Elysia marginata]|uniref:Uncharacterized protein n=1 Tax=Elysia marginata TaxID=1093978 RepID=A0AAV4IXJ7_9GAST|nr:hypothetical protein ElyMa_006757200 [Elysia marginata]
MAHYLLYMKPKLAREKARKEKLRQLKRSMSHSLKFINSNGMPPMSSAASKLMTLGPGSEHSQSQSTGQRSKTNRGSKPKEGAGSTGDSGTGGDSLSSGREAHNIPSQGKHGHGKNGAPWHSETSGMGNLGYRGDHQPGLRDLSVMSSSSPYMSAQYRGRGLDTQDVNMKFTLPKR